MKADSPSLSGVAFLDYDNDGFGDIFIANGHLMDNIEQIESLRSYPQLNRLLRDQSDNTFEDVLHISGTRLTYQI